MLRESEIVVILDDAIVRNELIRLKNEFINEEDTFIHINDDDFISLVLLAPSVGVALANGSISLFEELSLNKKARSLSRGSYFLKKSPVVHALKYLIENFDKWEDQFYTLFKEVMFATLKYNGVILDTLMNSESIGKYPGKDILNAPYIFIKFLAFMFLETEGDLMNTRNISKVEYDKIISIGEKLGLDNVPVFSQFCNTFEVKIV